MLTEVLAPDPYPRTNLHGTHPHSQRKDSLIFSFLLLLHPAQGLPGPRVSGLCILRIREGECQTNTLHVTPVMVIDPISPTKHASECVQAFLAAAEGISARGPNVGRNTLTSTTNANVEKISDNHSTETLQIMSLFARQVVASFYRTLLLL
ncbi:hypothetical protein CGCTS75_v002495 [Colletotrichum tropicale]|nr:hypothetical protein CGCTS75_v002495 [Colletotrichum tropicale]